MRNLNVTDDVNPGVTGSVRLRRVLDWLQRHWPILLVAIAFGIVGARYVRYTPVFETPDEPWHYRYVKHLADGRGLPPLSLSTNDWEQGEAHQPPLYYALGALLTRDIDTGAVEDLYLRNPYAALGLPHVSGNKNAVLHLGELSPPRTVRQAVYRLRWLSLSLSLFTVLASYAVIRQLTPRRPSLCWGTAALVAFMPQFLFIGAGVNNDTLVTFLSTLTLYFASRMAEGQGHPIRTPMALGVTVGLAALTKLSGLSLILVLLGSIVAYAQRRHFRRLWPDLLRPLAIGLSLVLAISGWWYVRNTILYNDPLGMRAMQATFSTRSEPLSLVRVVQLLGESLASYWGVFGWLNILADELFYTLTRMFSILGVIGLSLFLARFRWRRKQMRNYRWRTAVLLIAWILIVTVSLMRWVQLITGPQGRLVFPAIAAISFFLWLGASAWVPERFRPLLIGMLSFVLLGIAFLAPTRYIAPAYRPPQIISLDQVPESLRDVNVSFGDPLFLLGYEVRDESTQAGGVLRLRLYWLAKQKMSSNYTFYVHVSDTAGDRLGGVDTYPGGGIHPTTLWLPGDVVIDDYTVPIVEDATGPMAASVRVGVYDRAHERDLPAFDARGKEIGSGLEITRVRVGPVQAVDYRPQQALHDILDYKAVLMGYDLDPLSPEPGRPWEVTLYWRSLARMSKDYTVFVHLVNDAGEMVAQVDEQPLQSTYPTHLWQMGEKIRDPHILSLPADLAPGEYKLHIGLYDLVSGARLPLVEVDSPQDFVAVGPFRID